MLFQSGVRAGLIIEGEPFAMAGSIRSPCCKATLIRTSCRALPRSLTHTTIGKPVVFGRKFAIRKKSVSGSSIDIVTRLANRVYTHSTHPPSTQNAFA